MVPFHCWLTLIVVPLVVACPPVHAGAANAFGMTLDQTTTVRGQEFFRRFAEQWRETPYADTAVVVINERPSARMGSQVTIVYRRKPVFQAQLPPSAGAIAALGEQAVQVVLDNIVQADVQQLAADADLGRDEI
jgi:curli production assembly/transport component CsgE